MWEASLENAKQPSFGICSIRGMWLQTHAPPTVTFKFPPGPHWQAPTPANGAQQDPERELKPSVIRYISPVLGGFGVQRPVQASGSTRTESNYRPSRGRGPVTENSESGSGRTLLKFAAGSPLASGMAGFRLRCRSDGHTDPPTHEEVPSRLVGSLRVGCKGLRVSDGILQASGRFGSRLEGD